MENNKKYTVITGASSGIGHASAKAFAQRGKNLIVIARRQKRLEALKEELIQNFPDIDVIVKTCDLTDLQNAYRLYEDTKGYQVETWINNAGFGDYNSVAQQDLNKIEMMLRLNVEALTILSTLYVLDYKDIPGAQLINVSSRGGYVLVPNAVTYCATKFFVGAFTEGLAHELKAEGAKLKAKVLAPAATQTEFGMVANNTYDYDYDKYFVRYHTSEQIAEFLLQLYDNEQTVGIVHWETMQFSLKNSIFENTGNSVHNQKMRPNRGIRTITKLASILLAFLIIISGCSNGAPLEKQTPPSKPIIEPISPDKVKPSDNGSNLSKGQTNSKYGITLTRIAHYSGFQSPTGIEKDKDGNLYVSNWSGGTVTKIDKRGQHKVFVDGMRAPAGLAFDKSDNLYISDYSMNVIYIVTPNGDKRIFAQGLHTPTGIVFNKAGELLVANRSRNEIVKVDASGNIKTVAGGMRTPVGIVEDSDGNLYVTNYGGGIIKVTVDGKVSTLSHEFGRPGVGIDIGNPDNQKVIFAADNGDGCVRALAPDGTTEIVVHNIGGCVALLVDKNILYVGSWNDGAVYAYSIATAKQKK